MYNSLLSEKEYVKDVCNFVEDLMLTMSFRNSLVGRTYLRDCLVMVCIANKHTVNLTDEIYPVIAERYGTTVSSVYKAIRHCLVTCFNDGNLKRINRIFHHEIVGNAPLTNGEFITTMAVFIQRYLRAKADESACVTYFGI